MYSTNCAPFSSSPGRMSACVAFCAAMAFCGTSWAQAPPSTNAVEDEPVAQTFSLEGPTDPPQKPALGPPSQIYGVEFGIPVEVTPLDPIDMDAVFEEDAARALVNKVLRYGVGRAIAVDTVADGQWFDIPGVGRLWTVDVVAEGALGIRIHFMDVDLPPGAQIVAYAPSDPQRRAGPYTGRGVHGSGAFWSPTRFEDRVRIEYFVPLQKPGAELDDHPFIIDRIQHIYLDPLSGGGDAGEGYLPHEGNNAEPKDPAGDADRGERPDEYADAVPKDPEGGPRNGGCSSGGCTNTTTLYPSTLFTTTSSTWQTFTTCAYAGEHSRFWVTAGSTYEWSSCSGDGAASCSWDSQFMLRDTSGNNICYNDDWCGWQSKIRWMATFTGEVHLARMEYNCTTNSTCATLVWRRAPCRIDVTCYPSWTNTAKACAGIGWIDQNSLWCSGQLLNSLIADWTPYWLTANHCISTNSAAQSAEIYWLYQTSSCDGSPPPLSSVPQSAVCTLVSTGTPSDYTLLMVEGELPGGLFWAGWTSDSPSDGTACTGIHHPAGSYKRISFGSKTSTSPTHHWIGWSDGGTEGGSSGSGIFTSNEQWLIGQLSGNVPDCHFEDNYGAFSVTYPNISGFMAGGSDDGQENNDTCGSARTMGTGSWSNLIVKSVDEDWYRISVPVGGVLDIDLFFTDAFGDIDIWLYNYCGGSVVASSTSTTDNESISYTNPGGTANFYLRVFLYSDTRNQYNMTINLAPANDGCADSIPVSDGATAFDTTGAATDGPCHAACDSAGDDCVDSDIWYCYTATCTGTATASLCGSAYDTKLAAYSGCACPVNNARLLACNDDFCSLQSEVSFATSAGSTYLVRIGGYNAYQGGGTLTLTCDECQSNSDCNDGNPCTNNVCSGGTCTYPNNNAPCDDGTFCNGADTCSGGSCSQHAGNPCPGPDGDSDCSEVCNEAADNCTNNDPNGSACNDGQWCNGSDTCNNGSCANHTGNPCPGPDGDGDCSESCNESADNCTANDPNGSACNDGAYCNGADTCSGGGCSAHAGDPCPGSDGDGDCSESCNEAANNCTANDPNGSACNDGAYCNGTDTCSGGSCSQHAGSPCAGGPECADSCNEAVDNCYDPAGTPCTDDGNVCTDDQCNGSGSCGHPNNNDPCNDGMFCNGADTCAGGDCSQHAGDPCDPDEWCEEGGDDCLPYGNGDFEPDGDVDLKDLWAFQICFGQSATGGCEPANMAGDEWIGLDDFALFAAAMGGP